MEHDLVLVLFIYINIGMGPACILAWLHGYMAIWFPFSLLAK